jgi:hypothetical protein
MMKLRIPKTVIHQTEKLIKPEMNKIIREKVRTFNRYKMHDAPFEEVVGVLSGLEFKYIKDDENCGGYCSYDVGEIGLKKYNKGWLYKALFHELGHAFQHEMGYFSKKGHLFSHRLKMEWLAESIAYKMYNRLIENKHHSEFSNYFNMKHVLWLKEYYSSHPFIEIDIEL